MVTLNSLISVCIFSMLFTLQVLWHPQREFVNNEELLLFVISSFLLVTLTFDFLLML